MNEPSPKKSLMDLLQQIRKEQESFSAAQRQVASYVLENYHQIAFLPISTLAKNIGVSDNTVIKFCNQLGYAKFTEFKREFSEYAHTELVMYNKLSETDRAENANPFTAGMEEDILSIQTTLSDPVNQDSLDQLLPLVDKASHIYITGGRASGALAGFFASSLRYLDLRVHVIDPGLGDYWDHISMITPEDLVIAISLPRYTAEVVNALKHLHGRGVPVVLITDTGLSPAHPHADIAFHCSVTSGYYHLCFAGCMSLISVICRAVAAARKPCAAKHMHQVESYLLDNNIFL